MLGPLPGHRQPLHLADLQHPLSDDSELAIWRAMQAYLSAAAAEAAHSSYLDVGCGTGRIIGLFGGIFESVTCLEPDASRIAEANRLWERDRWGVTKYAGFMNSPFSELQRANESFDAISAIHVAQHVPIE